MSLSYFYKDGEDVKGPFEEKSVMDKYRKAEFTSDVQFQIRTGEEEEKNPFITLYDLMKRNGHSNPFSNEYEHLLTIIEEKQKEVDELSEVVAMKPMLEKRLDALEKKLEENMKRNSMRTEIQEGGNDETRMRAARRQKQIEYDSVNVFPQCPSCDIILSSFKQLQSHLTRSSCKSSSLSKTHDLRGDEERWKKEDEQRLAVGQRIYKRMDTEKIGVARPQIEFVDEIHERVSKKMKIDTDLEGTRAWLKSEEATKVKDRFVKHLSQTDENLVCTRCKVACRTHIHFIMHLCTYDHRLKVKGTPMEQVSLLIGHFHKREYLEVPDASELDEDLDVNNTETVPSPTVEVDTTPVSIQPQSETCNEEQRASMRLFFIGDWSRKEAMYCPTCGIIFSTYKQFLLHSTTKEHEEKSGSTQEGEDNWENIFHTELQKWRWEDRMKLSAGKKLYEEMSEEEKKGATPSEEFTEEMGKKLSEIVNKHDDGTLYGYLPITRHLSGSEGKKLMDCLEEHLSKATLRRFVCRVCKVAFDDTEKYFVHCQMAKHLFLSFSTSMKYISTLIGVHKKDLYFK